ncbi:MAG: hypothetical protein QW327_02535 [Candidatus Odinarchaeota archaeon]
MFKVTLTYPLRIGSVEFQPNFNGTGITVNNIPVTPAHIIHSRDRVDIGADNSIVYLVEHHIAALTLTGITDVHIKSYRESWNFYRPEDRAAYSTNSKPNMILGDPEGVIGGQLVRSLINTPKTTLKQQHHFIHPKKHVELEHEEYGYIRVKPLENNNIAVIKLDFNKMTLNSQFKLGPPNIEEALLNKISTAVTPFLSNSQETIYHVLGDVIGDLIGIGGIIGVEIEAHLNRSYHALTIGLVKKIISMLK